VALASFSDYMDVLFGKRIFGTRSLMLISIIHLFVFIALFAPLLYVFIDDNRRVDYGWTLQPSKSDFAQSRMEAKRLAPSLVYPDYDSAIVTLNHLLPLAGTTWLIASLLASCLLSYISLGITRSLLRRAVGSTSVLSLFMFVWLDFSIAVFLMLLFSIIIIELSATAVEIIVAMYVYWPRSSPVEQDALIFYVLSAKAFLFSRIADLNSIEWASGVSNKDQLIASLEKISIWEYKSSFYRGWWCNISLT
jgi:hypothetical protein